MGVNIAEVRDTRIDNVNCIPSLATHSTQTLRDIGLWRAHIFGLRGTRDFDSETLFDWLSGTDFGRHDDGLPCK